MFKKIFININLFKRQAEVLMPHSYVTLLFTDMNKENSFKVVNVDADLEIAIRRAYQWFRPAPKDLNKSCFGVYPRDLARLDLDIPSDIEDRDWDIDVPEYPLEPDLSDPMLYKITRETVDPSNVQPLGDIIFCKPVNSLLCDELSWTPNVAIIKV